MYEVICCHIPVIISRMYMYHKIVNVKIRIRFFSIEMANTPHPSGKIPDLIDVGELSLCSFKLWSMPALKAYLLIRNQLTTGTHEELAAR